MSSRTHDQRHTVIDRCLALGAGTLLLLVGTARRSALGTCLAVHG